MKFSTYCALGAVAVTLASCGPGTPTDPAPITPPENVTSEMVPGVDAGDGVSIGDTEPAQSAAAETAGCTSVDADGFCGVEFGMTAEEAKASFEGCA